MLKNLFFVFVLSITLGNTTFSQLALLDDFETAGAFPWAPWVGTGTTTTISSHSPTHSFSGNWTYRTDYVCGYAGEKISAWARAGTGRSYLGFGATPTGCWSFVMAPNTGDIRFQTNAGYGYLEMTIVPFVFTANNWYRMEIYFVTDTDFEGRLYAADGVTLLATVTESIPGFVPGGFALRNFAGNYIDDLETSCLAVILPVELVSFDGVATTNQNNLKWVVKSEINNDHYIVEHSVDGVNWSAITTVPSVGNSSVEQVYYSSHYLPPYEINYYRLSQIDFDGRTTILDEITIDNKITKRKITAVYDLLGRKINSNYNGIKLVVYDNGDIIKVVGPLNN